jgi:hypothetical protein
MIGGPDLQAGRSNKADTQGPELLIPGGGWGAGHGTEMRPS